MAAVMSNHPRIARKITATLFASQSFGSAGIIAGNTVAAIVGAQLSGTPALAGIPGAVQFAGTAFAAFLVGILMEKTGRRIGMVIGIFAGAIGAAISVLAIISNSFGLFLGGLALFGMALASLQLSRFAAAEVHPPQTRGRAIAYVILGGTVGSIAGPLLVGPSGRIAHSMGQDELAGPYIAAFAAVVMAAIVVFVWLRPDPKDVGHRIAAEFSEFKAKVGPTRPLLQIITSPGAVAAIVSMMVGQSVMLLVMGMTGLHMRANGHLLTSVSLVMSAHTFGMFAFSIISGRLTDKWGRIPVILCGAGILAAGSVVAAFSSEIVPLAISLFFVGLGWNFCYVGGSALLSDQLTPEERSRTQGVNDLLIYLSSAGVSVGSGVLFATLGYGGIGITGAVISLVLLLSVSLWAFAGRKHPAGR